MPCTGYPVAKLIIGGVLIPHSTGLLGHSDADVLLHAVTDALLGGAGLGDIGRHFPDSDERFAGADSRVLLAEAMKRVAREGYVVGNVDATIIAQAPRMAPHIDAMKSHLAADLGVDVSQVNIKAKTKKARFSWQKRGNRGRSCRPALPECRLVWQGVSVKRVSKKAVSAVFLSGNICMKTGRCQFSKTSAPLGTTNRNGSGIDGRVFVNFVNLISVS